MGKLIVIEGIDGTGKSTLSDALQKRMKSAGYDVLASREPTNGPWGQKIRALYTEGRESVTAAEELQWFLNDREEHVAQVIQPGLSAGRVVLLDRYYHSTVAYQGARGFNVDGLLSRNKAIAPEPDLTLILDLPVAEALRRVCEGRGDVANAFEQEQTLQRVKALYDRMVGRNITHIDAEQEPQTIAECCWKEVEPVLKTR